MDIAMDAELSPSEARIPFYKDWLLIPIIGLVYVLDQFTKHWVEQEICYGRAIPREGTFQLTCSFNSGTAFGLFPDHTLLLIFASFIGVGVLLLVYRRHPVPGLLLRISLGLQLGGAVGNLTDRIRFGQVTDFVKLGPWPVFNLADACIVVGIIMLVWLFIFSGGAQRPAPAMESTGRILDPTPESVPEETHAEQYPPSEQHEN